MSYGKNEFIKLNRRFLVWSRYKNVNDKVVFIHCLLKANWKDGEWKGVPVKRGQFISSVSKIAEECGLTYSKVRTSLDHLIFDENIETNVLDLSQEHSRKHLQGKPTLFTVVDYDKYQAFSENIETNSQEFSENNLRSLTTIEEVKNRERSKEVKKELSKDNSSLKASGEDERKPYQEYIDLWNSLENLGIQPIRSISGKRLISFRARLKEHGKDSFTECIEQIRQSEFLQKSNFFKFDWIVCETNYPKVLEGKYSDKSKQKQSSFDADEFLRRFDE